MPHRVLPGRRMWVQQTECCVHMLSQCISCIPIALSVCMQQTECCLRRSNSYVSVIYLVHVGCISVGGEPTEEPSTGKQCSVSPLLRFKVPHSLFLCLVLGCGSCAKMHFTARESVSIAKSNEYPFPEGTAPYMVAEDWALISQVFTIRNAFLVSSCALGNSHNIEPVRQSLLVMNKEARNGQASATEIIHADTVSGSSFWPNFPTTRRKFSGDFHSDRPEYPEIHQKKVTGNGTLRKIPRSAIKGSYSRHFPRSKLHFLNSVLSLPRLAH
jgi:hypothetical protein